MNHKIKPFTFVIIPDTQDVCTLHPDKLRRMTNWIVEHKSEWNIKKILHLGDLVNNGAIIEEQWLNHDNAFSVIEESGIPYLIAIGNHDYDYQKENRDAFIFNKYTNKYGNKSWFGGSFEKNKAENIYTLLEVYGIKFIFLSLEFGPRDEVLAWANEVLNKHSDYFAIVITHSYLYPNALRTRPGNRHNPKNYKWTYGANDGEDMWHKCIKKHKNILAVFSGHHINYHVSYRFDRGDYGNIIFQAFQNWQFTQYGGEARIRLLYFNICDQEIKLSTFNPQTETFEEDDGYALTLSFNLNEGLKEDNLDKIFANVLDPQIEKHMW